MKTLLFPALLLLSPTLWSQQPFPINKYGEVTDNSMDDLVKERHYELVSAFDTISKQPLLIYARYVKNGLFGILDINGKEVTPSVYKSITPNNYTSPNSFIVEENGKYGLIANTGKLLIPAKYDYLYSLSRDPRHYTARQGDQEFTIDEKGNKVTLPPEKDPWAQNTRNPDEEQKLSADGKVYYLRNYWTDEKTTVPNLGAVVRNYGNAVVFKNELGKMGLYVLSKKKLTIPFEYDEIEHGLPGYYKLRKGELQGAADSAGNIRIPLNYEHVGFTSGGVNAYTKGKYTIYDHKLKPLSDEQFDGIMYSGQKGLILKKDSKFGLMSTNGKMLTDFEYDAMEVPEDHDLKFTIILARKNGKYGVLDFSGKIYTEFKYDQILPESLVFSSSRSLEPVFNGYANQPNMYYYIRTGEYWGLLNNDFKPMIEPAYEYFLESYDRSVLLAKKNGKWGIINVSTEQAIIPFIYDDAPEYKDGNYQVKQNNQYAIINREGKLLLPLQNSNLNSEQMYKGLWKLTSYSDRTNFFMDYAGRKTNPEKWPLRERE